MNFLSHCLVIQTLLFAFDSLTIHLCVKKNIIAMKNRSLTESYELFSRLLLEDKIFMDSNISFSLLCSWIGADRRKLDAYIKSELGCSGEGLMETYRAMEFERIADKYKI